MFNLCYTYRVNFKKFFSGLGLAFWIFLAPAFSAELRDFEDRIQTIEELKQINADSSIIKSIYDELEKDTYTVSSLSSDLKVYVDSYNLAKTMWPINIHGEFLDKALVIDWDIELLYSAMMEKKYVPESEMTEYQRHDYEYYVNDYENRFRAGEELIYIEIEFSVHRWNGPSEYRMKPLRLSVYRVARKNREIFSMDCNGKEQLFSMKPAIEFRTEGEIRRDRKNIKKLLAQEETERKEKRNKRRRNENFDELSGRRAFFIYIDTEMESLADFELSTRTLMMDNIAAALTWDFGKYVFGGIEMAFATNSFEKTAIYNFGFSGGLNYTILGTLRPYLEVGVGLRTDDRCIWEAGAGMDVIFGRIMITSGWSYKLNKVIPGARDVYVDDDRRNHNYHSLSFGVGLTW